MSDKTLFPTPEGQKTEPTITRYAPAAWIDEHSPPPQADPNAFLQQKDGKWFLVPVERDFEDAGSYCIAAAHGDLIAFDCFRDYGSGTLSVGDTGGWIIDFVYPLDANTFYVDNDPETVMDSVDAIIRCQAENDPEFFSPPYETDINVSFWGDRTTFRVVIEGDAARLEKLPEPPLTLPYTNWRGETAIRNIRPIGVKFTATSWHKEPQWILEAYDYDRQEMRSFALKDFGAATPGNLQASSAEDLIGRFDRAARILMWEREEGSNPEAHEEARAKYRSAKAALLAAMSHVEANNE